MFLYERRHPDTPLKVSHLIRFCDKYHIESISTNLVRFVEQDWPSTVEELSLLQAEMEYWRGRYRTEADGEGKIGGLYFDDRFPEPASAIAFAREFGVMSILPFAFCMLAQIEPAMDWDELRSADGSASAELQKKLARGERSARWDLLDRRDLFRLHFGMHSLRRCSEDLLHPVHDSMDRDGDCYQSCSKKLRDRSSCGRPGHADCGPFGVLQITFKKLADMDTVHCDCTKAGQDAVTAQKQKVWESLRSYFQLDGQ